MSEFDPLHAFCEMHHDKLIDGDNHFGPKDVGVDCIAFMWSRTDQPYLLHAIPPKLSIASEFAPEEMTTVKKVKLTKVVGQTSRGYHLYILEKGDL